MAAKTKTASKDVSPLGKVKFRWQGLLPTTKRAWAIWAAGAIVVLAGILLAIPATRYGLLGLFVKRDITLIVTDSRTHKPVSELILSLNRQKLTTNAMGQVVFKAVPVGGHELVGSKKYYNLLMDKIAVPISGKGTTFRLKADAIGDPVTVKVINKINGKPLIGAIIEALGTAATTSNTGEANLVLPIGQAGRPGVVKADGYNDLAVTIKNFEQVNSTNTFALVPNGKVYFLSKRTGKINVMKSDLDGSNPTVVLAGTGREDSFDTVLLATRDWKYLALKAKRDSDKAKIYVISTLKDGTDMVDQGNADFGLEGWSGHDLVFTVARSGVAVWEPKQTALKEYDADAGKIKTLYETQAVDNGNYYNSTGEVLSNVYLVGTSAIFTKQWWVPGDLYYQTQLLAGKKLGVYSIDLTSGGMTTLRDWGMTTSRSLNSKLYRPDELLTQLYDSAGAGKSTFFEATGGKVTESADVSTDEFNNQYYPSFLQSPSGNNTVWYEPRDGKNTLFEGNASGGDAKQLASLSEFAAYGWYTDNYILLSKDGSELYIAPADMTSTPVKVTDYHKANTGLHGYGGGYGGGS
jgi:hypothetical protein